MQKNTRQANFELLRILAMFMVVVMHYLYRAGSLPENGRGLDGIGITAVVLESFCIVAVNVYVLISGYFLARSSFSFRRVGGVILQTLFYTVLIPPVLVLFGVLPLSSITDPYHIWNSIFPVQSGQYWFVTAYVVMCLFSPLLNAALEKLTQKQLLQALGALLLFFCVGKTLSPLQFPTDRYGYDFGWFMVLYLIGGYICRFGIPFFKSVRRGILVYLGSAVLTALAECALIWLNQKTGALAYYVSVPFHYNFLLCLTGAVGLFYAFLHIHVKEGRGAALIRFISPAVFGVYLIHEQADVAGRWFEWVNGLTGRMGREWSLLSGAVLVPVPEFLFLLLLHTAMVFAVCSAVDKVRGLLFEKLRKSS